MNPLRKSPLKRSGKPLKKISDKKLKALGGKTPFSTIRKKPRPKSATLRIYGPKGYVEWIQDQPCMGCGRKGYSDCAHIKTGGMGRKDDWTRTVPLCAFDAPSFSCHRRMHNHGREDLEAWSGLNLELAAKITHDVWLEHSRSREAVK